MRSCAEYRPSAPGPEVASRTAASHSTHAGRGRRSCLKRQGSAPATRFCSARERISGWIRVPNCSIPEMKSSNVSITPCTPGADASSSNMLVTEAWEPINTLPCVALLHGSPQEMRHPIPLRLQAMRTEIGRPSFDMRFKTWTATRISVPRRSSLWKRNPSPIICLYRPIVVSTRLRVV
jgi:hypothetical protein